MNCNYKVKMKDIQNKYKFKIFCAGYEYDDTEIRNEISQRALISEAGRYVELELNPNTYVLTAKLKDKNNNLISTSTPIDLPLESMIIDCDYDATTKSLIITLQNGNTTSIPLGDLIDGLATEEDLNEVRDNLEVVQNELNQYKTIYNVLPKVNGSGEVLTLSDTGNATLKMDLKGNTSQVIILGKNYFKPIVNTFSDKSVTITADANQKIKFNGTSTSAGAYKMADANIPSGTYTISLEELSGTHTSSKNIWFDFYNGSTKVESGSLKTAGSFTKTFDTNITSINLGFDSSDAFSAYVFRVQIESGSTATNWEPFTNNVPSPSPDSPSDVDVVSGDNTIKVWGKNLFDGEIESGTLERLGTKISNSKRLRTATRIFLKQGTYTISAKENFGVICYISDSGILGQYTQIENTYSNMPYTFTLNSDKYMLFTFSKGDIELSPSDLTEIQIESGTATPYEPYQSQSYPINLGTLELCKIGDYQDYIYKENNKWYKHSEIGKVVLDGSEDWTLHNSNASRNVYKITKSDILPYNNNDEIPKILLNYFTPISNASTFISGTASMGATKLLYLIVEPTYTLETFKAWLSTHNTTVYYVLATPTTTEITDATLISQLNALAGAESYSGQTNISQVNNDAPFIITAKALKDLSNL